MSLDELNEICELCSLYNDNFYIKEMQLAYNLSMMTQIDEVSSDRIN